MATTFLYLAEWLRRQRRRRIEEIKKKGRNLARKMQRLTRKTKKERYSEEQKEILKQRQHAKKR
jgi:hypothetical protein